MSRKAKILELLEIVAPILPAPMYWEDTNSVILGANEHVIEEAGLQSLDDYIGKTLYELYPKEMADAIKVHNEEVMRTGKILSQEEAIRDIHTGEIKYYTAVKAPLRDDKGNIIGIIGTSIDITERKKMEQDLLIAIEKAELADKAKAEFLRNMEHQLRTPFSGVYSLVHMLANEEPDPKKKELLEITYSSGKELLDFLNDVISFSRNQAETTAILAKRFDLKELIEKAISMEKPAAVVKELDLKFDYPEDLPTIFISDPKRIQRILLNLLSNAIKFTVRGSINIAVRVGKQIDEKNYIISILVTDTGIGIIEENQSLIYEKFYRVSPANQNKYQGAGLGLHIVKELIADLEGEIDLKSQLNEGSTFICTLPLKRPLVDEIITDDEKPKRGYFDTFKID